MKKNRKSRMARFYEQLTARSFLLRRKGGHLRLQQMLLSVPKLVGDSRVGSSRKLPGQLRCRQPSADVTVSTKTRWRFQGRKFPKTAWPASLQTAHAFGFGFLHLFSFVGTVSQGITAEHCAGSGKRVCNLDFEEGVSWFIVRFLPSFRIPDLSW